MFTWINTNNQKRNIDTLCEITSTERLQAQRNEEGYNQQIGTENFQGCGSFTAALFARILLSVLWSATGERDRYEEVIKLYLGIQSSLFYCDSFTSHRGYVRYAVTSSDCQGGRRCHCRRQSFGIKISAFGISGSGRWKMYFPVHQGIHLR